MSFPKREFLLKRHFRFIPFEKFWLVGVILTFATLSIFRMDALAAVTGKITRPQGTEQNVQEKPFWLNSIANAEGTPAEALTNYTTVYGGKKFNIIQYRFLPDLFREEELENLRSTIQVERGKIKERCDSAHRKGWRTFLRTYEVDYPLELREWHSETTKDIDERLFYESDYSPESGEQHPSIIKDIDKRLWFLESKVYEMFIDMPYLDGFQMTTSEAMASAETPELAAKYVEAAYRVLKRVEEETGKEKLLILRTWRSGPRESATLKFFPLPLKKEVAEKVIFQTKNTDGDYSMTNPFNPLIERLKESRQIMEFDVRGEYRGFSWYPQAMGKRWKEHLLKGIENNVIGVGYSWVDFEWPQKMETRNLEAGWGSGYPWHNVWANLNSYTLTELVKDISQDPEDIYRRWINLHFGKRAEEPLLRILDMSYDVMSRILYTHGIKHTDHSAFADNSKERSALDREDYTFAEYYTLFWPDGNERIRIDRTNVEAMIQEKIDAIEGARKMLKILQDNPGSFKKTDFLQLEDCLRGLVNYARANRYFMECYLRYRLSRTLVGVEQQKEIDRIFTVIKEAHELQFEEPDFPGRIGPKNFTILLDTIAGILLGDFPTYTTDWDLILNPPRSH